MVEETKSQISITLPRLLPVFLYDPAPQGLFGFKNSAYKIFVGPLSP